MTELEAVLEAESSPESNIDVDPPSEDTAHSSSADTDEAESTESLLDVVQNAYEANQSENKEEAVSESSTDEDGSKDQSEVEASDVQVEIPADDETKYKGEPFSKHPRFRELIAEKNRYREGADQFDRIKGFMRDNGLSAEDTVEGFKVMAMMKNDPAEAFKVLREKLNQVGEVAGYKLPQDIKQKIDDGYLDEASGRELSRARADLAREKNLRETREQQIQTQAQNATVGKIEESVTDWEDSMKESDPDWDLKADELDDRVRVLVAERGQPSTEGDALSLVREAYDSVNERYRKRTPAKRPIRTATGGKLGGSLAPEPGSLQEAMELALNR